MVRVLESTGGHFVIRRPDGREVLSTQRPMPVRRGVVSMTGKQIAFPDPPGTTYSLGSGGYRTNWPASDTVTDFDLGAYTDTVAPGFIAASVRARAVSSGLTTLGNGRFVHRLLAPTAAWTEWQLWGGGSYLAEIIYDPNDPLIGLRHIMLAVKGGRWVVEARHSSVAFQSEFTSLIRSMATAYELDIDIEWGIFK